MKTITLILVLIAAARTTWATKIADITRLEGQQTNTLTGMGLVIGLKGTGDGGAFLPAMEPLAKMLEAFDKAPPVAELKDASNVAVVMVTVTLPRTGGFAGDHYDVTVSTVGSATSLKDGQLFMTPMFGPTGLPYYPKDELGHYIKDAKGKRKELAYALAHGRVIVADNGLTTNGTIAGGADMEISLPTPSITSDGLFRLIIQDASASWLTASTLAARINEADLNSDGVPVARAEGPKSVRVQIPAIWVTDQKADAFVNDVLRLTLQPRDLVTEARVIIDTAAKSIVITGDVEVAPSVISHKGLTLTVVSPPQPVTARNPKVDQKQVIPLDTTYEGGAKLQDLAAAFDQLKVPTEDRAAILIQLHKLGRLHAKLTVDNVEQ